MTLLVSWVGIDPRGTSSLYIASDSKISWGVAASFEMGRKVFAFQKWPDVLGYCGDVLFPAIALNQIIDLADSGLLFKPGFDCKQKFQAIADKLIQLFGAYPYGHPGVVAQSTVTILHGSRDNHDKKKFFCHSLTWSNEQWRGEEIEIPNESGPLIALGSGANEFNENYRRYERGASAGTSRAVFHCFCDAIAHTQDPYVGGVPQVVGVYRMPGSAAMNFGVICNRCRYFLGARVDELANFDAVEWRNENFERCDGRTLALLPKAQRQPDLLRRP